VSGLGPRVVVAVFGIPPLLWAATSQHPAPVVALAAGLAFGCCFELLVAEGLSKAFSLAGASIGALVVGAAPATPVLGAVGIVAALVYHALPLRPRSSLRAFLGATLWILLPLLSLRLLNPAAPEGGLLDIKPTPLLLLWLSIWATDTFAYFVGKTVGRRPLASKVSPNKTVEGAMGGFVGAAAVSSLLSVWVGVPVLAGLAFGATVAVCGIVGDLLESRWKRSLGLKDSGAILPGHGGLLDRFDSLLLAAPVAALFLPLFDQLR